MKDNEFIRSTAYVSAITGLSERMVRSLSQDGIIPKVGTNQYDIRDVVVAFADYRVSLATKNEDESEYDRLTRIKADREQLKYSQEVGEMIPVSIMKEAFRDRVIKARSSLMTLSRRLASLKLPGDVRGKELIFQQEIEYALNALGNTESLDD